LINAIPSAQRNELVEIRGSVPDLVNPPSGCRFHPRCNYVRDLCKNEKPKVLQVEKDHIVACFLYEVGYEGGESGRTD
ncbi:unnamed protein product, partial [marine sediment metagenome]